MIMLQSMKRSVLEKQQAECEEGHGRDLPAAAMPVAWVMLDHGAGSESLGRWLSAV